MAPRKPKDEVAPQSNAADIDAVLRERGLRFHHLSPAEREFWTRHYGVAR